MSKPSKRVDVWMPLYVGDYLRDTTHLSTEQHGAYLLLILNYWNRGKALPDDDAYLARVSGLSNDVWAAHKRTIMDFFETRDGAWFHGRVEAELAKAIKQSEDKSKAGQKGAAVRYGRANGSAIAEPAADASQTHSIAIAGASQEQSQTHAPSSSSSSSPSQTKITNDTNDTSTSTEAPCGLQEAIDFGQEAGIPKTVVCTWFTVSTNNGWHTAKNRARTKISDWKKALAAFGMKFRNPPSRDKITNDEFWQWVRQEGHDEQRVSEWIEFNAKKNWLRTNRLSGLEEPVFDYKASLLRYLEKIERDTKRLN